MPPLLISKVQNHRIFITIREFRAFYTITPDFVRQLGFIHQTEAMLGKEIRFVGQAKDPLQLDLLRL